MLPKPVREVSACLKWAFQGLYPAAHVLFTLGDAWGTGKSHSGARRAWGSLDNPTLHAPESSGSRKRDSVVGQSRRGLWPGRQWGSGLYRDRELLSV